MLSFSVDILAIDLKDSWDALGEITGETANEEIINTVFEKFCVGK
jgi:tRNA modification GTPase